MRRIIVWNPFLDGLPGRLDGLERIEVEGLRSFVASPWAVTSGGFSLAPFRANQGLMD